MSDASQSGSYGWVRSFGTFLAVAVLLFLAVLLDVLPLDAAADAIDPAHHRLVVTARRVEGELAGAAAAADVRSPQGSVDGSAAAAEEVRAEAEGETSPQSSGDGGGWDVGGGGGGGGSGGGWGVGGGGDGYGGGGELREGSAENSEHVESRKGSAEEAEDVRKGTGKAKERKGRVRKGKGKAKDSRTSSVDQVELAEDLRPASPEGLAAVGSTEESADDWARSVEGQANRTDWAGKQPNNTRTTEAAGSESESIVDEFMRDSNMTKSKAGAYTCRLSSFGFGLSTFRLHMSTVCKIHWVY